jgi:hypothetical protein
MANHGSGECDRWDPAMRGTYDEIIEIRAQMREGSIFREAFECLQAPADPRR